MKKLILGSTQYRDRFFELKETLLLAGHEVITPAFDDHPTFTAIEVCEHNRSLIEWADEIHIFWDNRSVGFVFDMGMIFMSRKPIVIEYIEPKTLENVIRAYEKQFI